MDVRKWFLLNEMPELTQMEKTVRHVPDSKYRTATILRLFAAGQETGFRLTDTKGQPTPALLLMVKMMSGIRDCPDVELCRMPDLPPEEKKGFGKDDQEFLNAFANVWCLRKVTTRLKWAMQDLQYQQWPWVHKFLPGLDGAYIRYLDPDGKKRKRVCYIAVVPTCWEMTDVVYEGLWRWNFEHRAEFDGWGYRPAKTPDGYGILGSNPTLKPGGGQATGQRADNAPGATSGEALSPAG